MTPFVEVPRRMSRWQGRFLYPTGNPELLIANHITCSMPNFASPFFTAFQLRLSDHFDFSHGVSQSGNPALNECAETTR